MKKMKNPYQLRVVIPDELRREIEAEAKRIDRPVAWVMRFVWMRARDVLKTVPAPHTS